MLRALLKLAIVTIYSSVLLLYTLNDGYPRLKKSVPISVETAWVTNAETNYTEIMPPTCDYEGQSTDCGTCTIYVLNFELYYWPVGAVSDWRNATIKPVQTDFSAVINRTAFTSPSVYILMEQVFAINLCRPVGPTLTIVIVSVMPNFFSSVKNTVNFHTSPTVRPFNFANLNNLAPASVALAEFGCKPYERRPLSDCLPILEHRPWLAVPDEVLWLHPDWSTCVPSLVGLSCALTCPGAISPHNSGCCS